MAAILRIGELNEENIGKITRRLQEDEALREEAIEVIEEDPHLFIESVFDLDRVQSRLLRRSLDRDSAQALGREYITVLREGGEVDFEEVHLNSTPKKMGIPRGFDIQMDFSNKVNSFGVSSTILTVLLAK